MSPVPPSAPGPRGSAARLWADHLRAAFPTNLLGEDVAGVDLVMLDADLAGCITVWLHDESGLDAGRWAVLEARARDVARVVPLLGAEDERQYFGRLLELARLVLDRRG